jgi:hypothetical protein
MLNADTLAIIHRVDSMRGNEAGINTKLKRVKVGITSLYLV